MTTIIVVTISTIAVIAFGLFMKNVRDKGIKPRPRPAPTPKESPEAELKKILDALLKTNLMIRKDRFLPEDLLTAIETVIDDLKAATPAMMEKYPEETLTWEIKKIGLTHLHKIIKEYLDLSRESRQEQLETFASAVSSLGDVVQRARKSAEKNETAEFKTMAHFLAGKFS